jgi:hypothetical protein
LADQEDVRRLALALPGTCEAEDRFAFSVQRSGKARAFAWVWLERVAPRRARVPNPDVVALRVADLEDKELLLAAHAEALFTEPHYDGYPAVLVRLPATGVDALEALVTGAWRCQAPRALVEAFERGRPA